MTTISGFDVQGHRGARGCRPENTLPAFEFAIRSGVTTLEMDTVISRDRQVVVSHDPFFSSAFCSHPDGSVVTKDEEKRLRLFEMTYEEIRSFDCGRRGHPNFPDQLAMPAVKPLLIDVIRSTEDLAATMGRSPLLYNIETKSQAAGDGILHPGPVEFIELLMDVIDRAGVAARTTIQSFDMRTLRVLRSVGYVAKSSLLVDSSIGSDFESQTEELGFVPDIYSPDFHVVSEDLMRAATKAGVQVLPWTVNTKDDLLDLIALGVRGIITDYPDRTFAVLREAGIRFN